MKLTKETLKDIILEEMQSIMAEADEEVGSFYKTESGAQWNREMGINGLMDALEEAREPIARIQRVAEACRTTAGGGEDDFAIDQENYDFFNKMVEICDNLLETMQYNVFLQFELGE